MTYFLDKCIYDEDSVTRVLYSFQHGHQVESHTWSHPDLTTLTSDQSQYQSLLVLCLLIRHPHNILLIAVHDQMWRIERKLHVIFSCFKLLILIAIFLVSSFALEALQKIAGVYPAMMRPRSSFADTN